MANLENEITEFTFVIQHVQLVETGRFYVRVTVMTSPVNNLQPDIKVQKTRWTEADTNSAMTEIFENNFPEEVCKIVDNTFTFIFPPGMCRSGEGQFVYLLIEAYKVIAKSKSVEQLCKRVGFRRFIVHPRIEGKKHRSYPSEEGLYSLTSIMTLLYAPNSENCQTYPTQIKFIASLKIAGKPAVSPVSLLTTPVAELPHMTYVVSNELPNVPIQSNCTMCNLIRERPFLPEMLMKPSATAKSMSDARQSKTSFTEPSMALPSKIPVYEDLRKYLKGVHKASIAKVAAQGQQPQKESSSLQKIRQDSPPQLSAQNSQPQLPASRQLPAQPEPRTSATENQVVEEPETTASEPAQAEQQAVASANDEIQQTVTALQTVLEQRATARPLVAFTEVEPTRTTLILSEVDLKRPGVSFTEVQPLPQTPSDTKQNKNKKKHKKRKPNNEVKRTILDQLPVTFKAVPMGTEALIGAILPAILPALATVPPHRHVAPDRQPLSDKTDGKNEKKERSGIIVSTKNFFRLFKQVPAEAPEETPVEPISDKPAETEGVETVRMKRHIQQLRNKVAQLEAENEYLSYAGPDLSCGSGSVQEISLYEISDGGSLVEI